MKNESLDKCIEKMIQSSIQKEKDIFFLRSAIIKIGMETNDTKTAEKCLEILKDVEHHRFDNSITVYRLEKLKQAAGIS